MIRRNLLRVLLVVVLAGLPAPGLAADMSTEALMVLTEVGYMTGAADGCKVAAKESNALSSGMAIAISGGKYGDPAEAHVLLNNARQRGVANAAAGKVDCAKVAASIRDYSNELLKP